MTPNNISFERRGLAKLRRLGYLYHAKGESFETDTNYDQLYERLKPLYPSHEVFNNVGSKDLVKASHWDGTGNGKDVALPIGMGSLNKLRPDDLPKWMEKIAKNSQAFVATPKLDGVAIMLEYSPENKLVEAYTRGNGKVGTSVLSTLRHIEGIPRTAYSHACRMFVRGELIISKSDFDQILKFKDTTYVNARNALVGCVNAKVKTSAHKRLLKTAKFFAYSIDFKIDKNWPGSELPDLNYTRKAKVAANKAPRSLQLKALKKKGFDTVLDAANSIYPVNFGHALAIEEWPAKARKFINLSNNIDYECDGLVIDFDSESASSLGFESNGLNPVFSRAVKLDPSEQLSKIVKVSGINWSRTRRGLYKPVVALAYDAVFQGVRVRNTYADNAGWILSNGVDAGAVISIIRSGDVIPRIVSVIEKAEKVTLPEVCFKHKEKLVWTDTKTDLYCPICAGELNSPAEFFATLNPDNIGKKIVDNLGKELGLTTVKEFLELQPAQIRGLKNFGTKSAFSFCNETRRVVKAASLAQIMHASGAFRSPTIGLAETRLQDIIDKLGAKELMEGKYSESDLLNVVARIDGLGSKVANCFSMQFPFFKELYEEIKIFAESSASTVSGEVKSEGGLSGLKFAFTGFRNKDAEIMIKNEGGAIANSVSKTTKVLFAATRDTVKTKKAVSLGVTVVDSFDTEEYLRKIIKKYRAKKGLPDIKKEVRSSKNMTRKA